jgi:hypothetical protein
VSGAFDATRTSGAFDATRASGAFEATRGGPADATRNGGGRGFDASRPATGPFSGAAPGNTPLDAPRTPTGPFGAAPLNGSAAADPLGGSRVSTGGVNSGGLNAGGLNTGGINTGTRAGGIHTEPPWPAGSYSSAPTPPAPVPSAPVPSSSAPLTSASSTPASGWPGPRDVLDDPEPPRSSSSRETWPAADYQSPSYAGTTYSSTSGSPTSGSPASGASYSPESAFSSGSPYEVSAGWATIDEDDSAVTGPTPASSTSTGPSRTASPYDPSGYSTPGRNDDVLSGGYYGGYEPDRGSSADPVTPAAPGATSGWPEQDGRGSWPSYGELYGTTPNETDDSARGRRGSHRTPDPDYPDYYR